MDVMGATVFVALKILAQMRGFAGIFWARAAFQAAVVHPCTAPLTPHI